MRVYIAAKYEKRDEAIEMMRRLVSMGYVNGACWLRDLQEGKSNAELAEHAKIDVEQCDILIAKSAWFVAGTNARAVELGIAIAYDKEVWLVGSPENIFWHYPGTQRFHGPSDMYRYAAKYIREARR